MIPYELYKNSALGDILFLEILNRTPSWVFVLLFALLALGYVQSKDRTLTRIKVLILPTAMLVLSLLGIFSAFGAARLGLGCWALGSALAVAIGLKLGAPRGVRFSVESQTFYVPGSWTPLVLMMAIFLTKYIVGVIFARELPIATTTAFLVMVSFCYGVFYGAFLARAIVIWRKSRL
jgi:hypothetical protein